MKTTLKTLIVAATLGLIVTGAHAFDVATSQNTEGGLIVLTNDVSDGYMSCTTGKRMYTTVNTGLIGARGCWTSDDLWVFVRFDGETQVRRYVLNGFTLTEAAVRDLKSRQTSQQQ